MKTFRFLLFLLLVVIGLTYGIAHAGMLGDLSKAQSGTFSVWWSANIGTPAIQLTGVQVVTTEYCGVWIKTREGRFMFLSGTYRLESE